MKNTWRKLVALALVVIASVWLINLSDTAQNPADLSKRPQFYMQDFQQHMADAQGKINTQIQGESLDLFTKTDYAVIKNPKLTTYIHSDNPWQLTASHAQGFKDKILLSGNVHAQSFQKDKQFYTESLWLNHHTGTGNTKDKVRLKNGILQATGTGAEFNSATGEIKLLADTFTTYEATHTPK